MLCEGILLRMTYGELQELHPLPPDEAPHAGLQRAVAIRKPNSSRHTVLVHHSSTGLSPDSRSPPVECLSPLVSSTHRRIHPGRQISPEIEIPAQARSGTDAPFLVPSFCQSICKNYSDLHIGGDQVLPLLANESELGLGTDPQADGPFLQSCDVQPAVEGSLLGHTTQGGLLHRPRVGLSHWRQGSGRDQSFLFQGCEGPFSNSFLNRYLEHKVLDLYQQYMMEKINRQRAPGTDSDPGAICNLLGSEMILTSLDQITLQLSREGNLEAGLAKDMVLSCLLRVAGDMQSSEISTPCLQISNESSKEPLAENEED